MVCLSASSDRRCWSAPDQPSAANSLPADGAADGAADPAPSPPPPPPLTWAEFERVEIRVGTIRAAEPTPGARKPAYRLRVDFGPEAGERTSSAQITTHYTADRLIGRQVIAVLNFPPKQIGKTVSTCLVLGLPDGAGGVVLLGPDQPVPNGGRLF